MEDSPTYGELQKRAQELERQVSRCQEREKDLRIKESAIASAMNAIVLADMDSHLTYVNSSFLKLWGYDDERQVLGRPAGAFCEREDVVEKVVLQLRQNKAWVGELVAKKRNGSLFDVQLISSAVTDENGKPICMKASLLDITARKQAEEALKSSETQKRAILDASVDKISLVDTDMRIVWANKMAARELGADPEDLAGKICFEVFMGRNRPCDGCPSKKSLNTGQIEHAVIHQPRAKDAPAEVYWDAHAIPIKDESGAIINLVQISRDITRQRMSEMTLREREQELKAKTNSLKEVNTALRVLLDGRVKDKADLEEKVLFNVKELVLPFLEKLKRTPLSGRQISYLHILESNLNDIISPFSRALSAKYLNLTPTEMHVANLVKEGRTTKEIAVLMDLSSRTIEFHRDNIRTKMGIKNRRANLRSHLLSI